MAYHELLRAKASIDPEHTEMKSPQTAAVIADRIGTSPQRIEDAIDYLVDQSLPVTTVEYEGERQGIGSGGGQSPAH